MSDVLGQTGKIGILVWQTTRSRLAVMLLLGHLHAVMKYICLHSMHDTFARSKRNQFVNTPNVIHAHTLRKTRVHALEPKDTLCNVLQGVAAVICPQDPSRRVRTFLSHAHFWKACACVENVRVIGRTRMIERQQQTN